MNIASWQRGYDLSCDSSHGSSSLRLCLYSLPREFCYTSGMTKQDVFDFIKTNGLAVVATTDSHGSPQAAVVEYGELEDFTIIIDTLKSSRKYKNIQQNDKVAIVIGWDNDITVQIDAVAIELNGKRLDIAEEAYFKKNERARKWETRPEIAYFACKPTWLRYSDVSKSPWQIEEFSF